MNWTAIITALAVITGIYFLWTWLSRSEANPTTQEAFSNPLVTDPATGLQYAPPDPNLITSEIPAIVPDESLTYETIYNIVVEAPVIPDLNTSQIVDDLVTEVKQAENDPIIQPTGGADQLVLTKVSSSGGKTYSTPKAIQEKTVTPIFDPVKMVTDTVRPSGSFGGR
jgi:hypothetical protein